MSKNGARTGIFGKGKPDGLQTTISVSGNNTISVLDESGAYVKLLPGETVDFKEKTFETFYATSQIYTVRVKKNP